MSWSISKILKPFKKLAVAYYQVQKLSASPRVLYLIIHSCSFFKQYITTHIQVFCTIQGLSPSTLFYQGGKGVFRDAWWESQIISLMRDRAQISRVRREWCVIYYFHNAWRVIFLWNLRDDWYHSKLVLVMTPTSCPFMSFLDLWFPQIGYLFM